MSTRTLRILTWLLVAAIAAIAFAVSFEAISQYAVAVGAFPRSLRYCAPLLVDAFTVAAGLVILARARDGVRAVYAWSLVAVASAVSIALNVAHAPRTLAAQLVAALPPAALLASLELVLSEARRTRGHTPTVHPTAEAAPVSAEPTHTTAAAVLAGEQGSAEGRTSRDLVRQLVATGRGNAAEVVAATGVGKRRAYELLAQVKAEGNGSGGNHA
jgi:hypothetical protein